MHESYRAWYEDGTRKAMTIYKDSKKNGPSKIYYTDGVLERNEYYKNGIPHGKWTRFDRNGKPVSIELFDTGKSIKKIL
jgi:antitoxin component YwqK of YwqJK toxin-antitoxin module